ncbi:MAG: phosphate starvation-inducible protein PhoH, partial [Desulfobulbaceae bacterium]|nr:phosphate starvation-inducible protein PhoH [Desulfobulbaceae bacterium]
MAVATLDLKFADNEAALLLYGDLNRNLAMIETAMAVKIEVRGTELAVSGQQHDLELVGSALNQLYEMILTGSPIYQRDIAYALRILSKNPATNLKDIFLDQVFISAHQGVISPKSINQKNYIEAIR